MTASEADANRSASVDLIGWNPDKLMYEVRKLTDGPTLFAPDHHAVLSNDINPERLERRTKGMARVGRVIGRRGLDRCGLLRRRSRGRAPSAPAGRRCGRRRP